MSEHAILRDGQVIPVPLMEWATAFDRSEEWRVARTELEGVTISTVFLGLNHRWGDGPPLWFETLVFGGLLDGEMERYTTLEEAMLGHERMVARVAESAGQP